MSTDLVVFFGLAFVSIATAVLMIATPKAIYSALYLVLNFTAVAIVYLLMNAPFIALIQITVYAGAIMVLFLFVIMLLGIREVETSPSLPMQMPVAIVLAGVLALLLGYALLSGPAPAASGGLAAEFGTPRSVGELLFSRYLIPFEVTSILLLVAMVGAIILSRDDRDEAV